MWVVAYMKHMGCNVEPARYVFVGLYITTNLGCCGASVYI